jgi:hypothetical protein
MATREEKALKKEAKARAEFQKELAQKRAKEARRNRMSRLKYNRKPSKQASKDIKKEGNRLEATKKIQKVQKPFVELKPWLKVLAVFLIYNWTSKRLGKERQERDIREAQRFLHKLHYND